MVAFCIPYIPIAQQDSIQSQRHPTPWVRFIRVTGGLGGFCSGVEAQNFVGPAVLI